MKEAIRELILSSGADICGFANIDRFDHAPLGFKPTDVFADCKSVISLAVALPQGLAEVDPRLVYGHYNELSVTEVDSISFKVAKRIERIFNCIAVPLPCDSPYEYWDVDLMEGRGLVSMRHIAVQAGLGTLGKNTLFINQQYGNVITLGAILTNLDLQSDGLASSLCLANCNKCVDACPVQAIENNSVNQKLCRNNTYSKNSRGFDTVECNKCRTACPLNSGKSYR